MRKAELGDVRAEVKQAAEKGQAEVKRLTEALASLEASTVPKAELGEVTAEASQARAKEQAGV